MFTDRVRLQIKAGKGGNGVISWRREKYIPKGGPAGGDGGKGGSVYLEADGQLSSLEAFRNQKLMRAGDGASGGSNQKQGKDGSSLVIKVPCGTLVKEEKKGTVLFDLTEPGQKVLLCQGGKGGKGNVHFKSPTNRTPYECTLGEAGEEKQIELELKLIADVGLVGFPNAGKSTLLGSLTQIAVKTGAYPFTTLTPNVAFIRRASYEKKILLADIPGIIEGAHEDRGLGLEFLRHIERTSFLLFVLDASGIEGRTPWDDYKVLRKELKAYDASLLKKPSIIALNKMDSEESQAHIKKFRKSCRQTSPIFEISALSGEGLDPLIDYLGEAFQGVN